MKVRLAALSIALVASASISSQSVYAEGRGARFNFAPNIYKLEQPNVPKPELSAGAPSRPAFDGKVPHGPSFLGINPRDLVRPAPAPVPVTRTQVAMRPSPAPTNIRSPFSPNFGEPTAPPAAAHPGMLPNFGSPAGLHPDANSSDKAVSGKLLPHKSPALAANRSVSGRLVNRRHASGQSANPALALKPIETYGNQFFSPGRCLPISSGSGMTTRSDVYGRVLQRKH